MLDSRPVIRVNERKTATRVAQHGAMSDRMMSLYKYGRST